MKTSYKTLEEEKRKIKEEISRLKEIKKKKNAEMSMIENIIWKEINREVKVYLKNDPILRKYNLTNYQIQINGYSLFVSLLYTISYTISLKSLYNRIDKDGCYIWRDNVVVDVENISQEEVKVIFYNAGRIFKFIKEREDLHKTYDVISTKKSVLLLMHSFRDLTHFKKFPRDIMILICKKALNFLI